MSRMLKPNLLQHYPWLQRTLFLTTIFLIAFWIYFFLVENKDPLQSQLYLTHERAFAIPDIFWIVILLLLSNFWLKRNNLKGIISSSAAGGALVFLAIVDICYNFQQGLYLKSLGDGILNSVINLLSLGYGLTLVYIAYQLLNRYVKKK